MTLRGKKAGTFVPAFNLSAYLLTTSVIFTSVPFDAAGNFQFFITAVMHCLTA
jgi:hypothetical protein